MATNNHIKSLAALTAMAIAGFIPDAAAEASPLKVYILAGQSNMEGRAKLV